MKDHLKTKAQLIKDLTEIRKELQEVNKKYNSGMVITHPEVNNIEQTAKILNGIIENNPISIQIVNEKGITIKANHAHYNIFKAPLPPEYSIFTDEQLIVQGLDKLFEKLIKGEVVNFPENHYNAHDLDSKFPDNLVYIRATAFPIIENGKPILFVIMHENITKYKENEKELNEKSEYIKAISEMEKKTLARELHDDMSPLIAAIKIDAESAMTTTSDDLLNKILEQIVSYTVYAKNSLTELISVMRHVTIEDFGICAAIKKYAVQFGQRHKLEMVLKLPHNIKMSYDVSLIIFHVMQLALQNVAEHAKAKRVDIELRKTKASIYLILADNGIGITAQQLASNKSFGIIGMREHAKTAGGRLIIENGAIEGTTVEIIIPLNKS